MGTPRVLFASLVPILTLVLFAGCGGGSSGSSKSGGRGPTLPPPDDTGVNVVTTLPSSAQAELAALTAATQAVSGLSSQEFAANCEIPFLEELTYDPLTADGLELIQGSDLSLDAKELSALGTNGFVIADGTRFGSFFTGYERIYVRDLPLYVSADSILHALHRSFDAILKTVEIQQLIDDLSAMLDAMREGLGTGRANRYSPEARADADLYLTVAVRLLREKGQAPVAGGDAEAVESLVAKANSHSGTREVTLFGVPRLVDFSQFKPRGHYTDHYLLERYFRAAMWLGRIDLRILETQPDGSQVFRRRQLEAACLLRDIMDEEALARWSRIEAVLSAFMGPQDNMTIADLAPLLADLGAKQVSDLEGVADDVIAQAVVDGGYGTQRICSHLTVNRGGGTLPLSSTFQLLGQRYTADSHVFSNVVYDRAGGGSIRRMMPDPRDVAYAAFGNDHAGTLLADELARYPYAPDLEAMRILLDGHGEEFRRSSLYNLWVDALRRLSPDRDEIATPGAAGIPEVAATELWARRLLSAQLASWAELRHDTILYAKQSYSSGAACEYPDVYVEPVPEFFAAIGEYAKRGIELGSIVELPGGDTGRDIGQYFTKLRESTAVLREMAEYQREGKPFTEDHMTFVNRAVRIIPGGSGMPPTAEGWYADMFFDTSEAVLFDPTIADVHTQPTDEIGNDVGRVLHVATGMARLMVVTADTCAGPRAYVGLVSSYYEQITEDYERLSDEDWLKELQKSDPPPVPWMDGVIVR